jgi:C-terminal processing protease CtpA/Prc
LKKYGAFSPSPHTPATHGPTPKQATAQLRSVLYAEERVGASAYILDMRNNMGGIFQEALKMAALFLPDPKVSQSVVLVVV